MQAGTISAGSRFLVCIDNRAKKKAEQQSPLGLFGLVIASLKSQSYRISNNDLIV